MIVMYFNSNVYRQMSHIIPCTIFKISIYNLYYQYTQLLTLYILASWFPKSKYVTDVTLRVQRNCLDYDMYIK